MADVTNELLSEQCIAQILENDLRLLESVKQAEKLQLDNVVAVSAQAQGGRIPEFSQAPQPELDVNLAFETYLSDARTSNDGAYAQLIQNEIQAKITQDWQYAQRVSAAERSERHICFVLLASSGFYPGKSIWMPILRVHYKL